MRQYALLGHPVQHSRSPAIHNHWFATHGIDGRYSAIEVPAHPAPDFRRLLTEHGLSGANLTVPHKRNIVPDLDHLTPAARACDAVNTVWRDGDAWWGDNTDARGFIDAVVEHRRPDFTRPAAVLGVGGAGRAVASGLASAGVAVIHLLNRTRDSAEAAAAHLAQHHPDTRFVVHPLTPAGFNAVADSLGVVATCVSGPGLDAIHALSVAPLSPRVVWVDLNYWCDEVPHAETLGDRLLSGSPMLAHQAAHAFARWTGVHPDPNDLPMGT